MAQLLEIHHGAQGELAKVRAEGDLIMIKIEMEKKQVETTQKEIEAVKAQIAALHSAKLQENTPSTDLHKHVKILQQQDERQKGHLCEELAKLAQLRQSIDQARRVKKDALAAENEQRKRAKELCDMIASTQTGIDEIKLKEQQIMEEMHAVETDIASDQAAFLSTKKELNDQLNEYHKPVQRAWRQTAATKSSVIKPKRKETITWLQARNKMHLVKRTETLEQKKELLEALLSKTGELNVQRFLERYLRQEEEKERICFEIERQSKTNAAMQAKIRLLEAEKLKLQGHDIHALDGLNPYCEELQKEAQKSRDHAAKFLAEARHYEEISKKLHDPLEQLYRLTHPLEKIEPLNNGTQSYVEILASIEERVTELVLSKIAHEYTDHNGQWEESNTLMRLFHSRGMLKQKNLKGMGPLPSCTSNDEDDEEDHFDLVDPDESIPVVHSKDLIQEYRERHSALVLAASISSDGRKGFMRTRTHRRSSDHSSRRSSNVSKKSNFSEKELKSHSVYHVPRRPTNTTQEEIELLSHSKMVPTTTECINEKF